MVTRRLARCRPYNTYYFRDLDTGDVFQLPCNKVSAIHAVALVSGFATTGTGNFALSIDPFVDHSESTVGLTESGTVPGLGGTIVVDYDFFGDKQALRLDSMTHAVDYNDGTGAAAGSGSTVAVQTQ